MPPDLRQNVIISRLNAEGVVQVTSGAADQNKVVKTNSSGIIDSSFLSQREAWMNKRVEFTPDRFMISAPDTGLFNVDYEIDTGAIKLPHVVFEAAAAAQQLVFAQSIKFDVDNIVFSNSDALVVEHKTSNVDPGNTLSIDIYKNDTLMQTCSCTLSTSFTLESFPREEVLGVPYEFNDGDNVIYIATVNCNDTESIMIRRIYSVFEVLNP